MGIILLFLTWFIFGGLAVKINEWFFHGESSTVTLIMIIELALFLYIWAKNDELISDTLKEYFFISIKPRVKKIKRIKKEKAEKICREKIEKCLSYVSKYGKSDNIPILEERLFYEGFCRTYGKEFVDGIYEPLLNEYKLFRDKENIIRSMKVYKQFKKEGWV